MMTDFILTNEDRHYLGLSPIKDDWSVMKIKHVTLYLEGNWIKKMVRHSEFETQDFTYFECDVLVETSEDKSLVLPKTKRGKPKKLNYTATTTFHPIGVYLRYEEGRLTIGNFTTQKTFYYEWLTQEKPYKNAFDTWLLNWKNETTENDLKDLDEAILSTSSSITHSDTGIAYLQYGLIYREIPKEVYEHHAEEKWLDYRNEGIGFSLFLANFEACIRAKSNQAYYDANPSDLRNPKNKKDKEAIFSLFGLDASLDYKGNLDYLEEKDRL